MPKIAAFTATLMVIVAAVIAAPGLAEARFGAGAIADAVSGIPAAQPAQYYSGQRTYRPNTPPRTYTPRYTPPRTNNAPRYIYPGSRDALDTCAFC